jgi:hypothetical protein
VDPVATAVARAWTKRLRGGDDAISAGRDGCIRSMSMS